MTDSERFIVVGRLGRTRGVKGEICITPATDFPERFLDLKEIYTQDASGWKVRSIESSKMISGRPVIRLNGCENREQAAALTGTDLAVPAGQVVELPDDVHYVFELVGCKVIDMESNRQIGYVKDVIAYPANDVYVVRTGDGKDVLFPAVSDFVVEIDTSEKKIVVKAAGLFDSIDEKG